MGKFKVGDRVRAKEGSAYSVKKDDVRTVTEILNENAIRFRKPDGTIDGWGSENFELVEQPWQPKVGDRVRFTDECKEYWWFGPHTENKEGVVSLDRGADYDFDDGRFEVRTSDSFGIVGLKHIEPLPVAAEAQPATLTIQAGKFYRTRDGRKVGPMRVYGGGGLDRSFAFGQVAAFTAPDLEDERVGGSYTSDGTWLTSSGHSPYDLIAEWVDEPAVSSDTVAVAATASNDNEPVAEQPAYKVGDKVRSLVDWCDTKVGDILPITTVSDDGVWATDRLGDETYLAFQEIEPAPQQSTAGFTIPLVEDEPASAKDGSTQLTVRITSDFTELHDQIDYAFDRLKKLKKKARKLGIDLDFAKAA
ncbi:hypothetical protein [Sinorhizobium meliloti]|uniref:hypothetical protein n=1 Tax=Rhizobium meliloti TaxID=382 RepID=UPI001911276A|nr:hypothetical protein [Sinorhizobium meliloti]